MIVIYEVKNDFSVARDKVCQKYCPPYAILSNEEHYDDFIKECGRVFNKYAVDGLVVENHKKQFI